MTLNKDQLKAAIEWITECAESGCFRDLECEEDVLELSDAEIERGIEKNFSGGLKAFLESFN